MSSLQDQSVPSPNSTNPRGTNLKRVKYLRDRKLAAGKDGKRVRGGRGRGEEVKHCVFVTPIPPELAVQSSGSESMNISPLPKQKCIIRTESSLSERDFLAKNGKSVRCPRRAKCGGLARTSLPRSPSLLWNSARHWERKGGVSLCHLVGTVRPDPLTVRGLSTPRKAHRATDGSPFPLTLL